MEIKCQIIMLPTDVSNRYNCTQGLIVKCVKSWTPTGEIPKEVNKLSISVNHSNGVLKYYEPQHLYILSNEEIKVGDWAYINDDIKRNFVAQIKTIGKKEVTCRTSNGGTIFVYKPLLLKIIATTDIFLNLLAPSPEFIESYIESYNNGKPIEWVNVECEKVYSFEAADEFDEVGFCGIKPKINENKYINVMEYNELKQTIINNLKKEVINDVPAGGQSWGPSSSKARIYSEDLDIAIECGYHRSALKNVEMIVKIFENIIDKI